MNGYLTTQKVASALGFMVYFKGPKDTRFKPMSIKTGELFDRLALAPIYSWDMLEAVQQWIDHNKQCAPDCKLQIRAPGTNRILYT